MAGFREAHTPKVSRSIRKFDPHDRCDTVGTQPVTGITSIRVAPGASGLACYFAWVAHGQGQQHLLHELTMETGKIDLRCQIPIAITTTQSSTGKDYPIQGAPGTHYGLAETRRGRHDRRD